MVTAATAPERSNRPNLLVDWVMSRSPWVLEANISLPFEFGEGRSDISRLVVVEKFPFIALRHAGDFDRFFQGFSLFDQATNVRGDVGEIVLLGHQRSGQFHGMRPVARHHARGLAVF